MERLMCSLKVCIALSARPFVEGWYGAEVTCRIPLRCRKSVNSTLVMLRPFPRLDSNGGREMSCLLTGITTVDGGCGIFVHSWPPNKTASKTLHAGDSRMSFMKFRQNSLTKGCGYDNPGSPENASILDTQFVLALVVGRHL